MNETTYDVIIVGAGPGGCVLAARMAQLKFKVLILEKALLPRYKTCGGGLTSRALARIPIDVKPVIRDEIRRFNLVDPLGVKYTYVANTPKLYTVMRDELDMSLAQYAVSLGAELLTDHRVVDVQQFADKVYVVAKGQTFDAKFVVGADGVNSVVAQRAHLMLHREKTLSLEIEVPGELATMSQFTDNVVVDFSVIRDGYGWIFPKRDHLSVGIGSYGASFATKAHALEVLLHKYHLPGRAEKSRGFHLSVGGNMNRIVTSRVALLGDAAGLVDACGGEGIYYALWSADLLSKYLEGGLHKDTQALHRYQQHVDREIVDELRKTRKLSRMLYGNPRLVHHALKLNWVQQRFFEYLEGAEIRGWHKSLIKSITGLLQS